MKKLNQAAVVGYLILSILILPFESVLASSQNECPDIKTGIVSDTTTEVEGLGAASLTYSSHPDWTASIPGASWIWSSYYVADPLSEKTEKFIKKFNINEVSSVTSAILNLASDNTHTVFMNGNEVGNDASSGNTYFDSNKKVYDVASYLQSGDNILSVVVTNLIHPQALTQESNPAGLLYRLDLEEKDLSCASTNTPPTITLNGNNPFNLNLNTPFVEPGFSANDAEDGNITSKVVVSGSVNASSTGTYTLTYSVTDSGGLSASTTRSVVVLDGNNPPPQNSKICLIPELLSDNSPETISASQHTNEKTLQEILIDASDVNDDVLGQKQYEIWRNNAAATTTIEVELLYTASFSDPVFGYYINDGSNFNPVFRTRELNDLSELALNGLVPKLNPGEKISINLPANSKIDFALYGYLGKVIFNSENSKNADNLDHLIVYNALTSTGPVNKQILAFDDMLHMLADADYNDFVVRIDCVSNQSVATNTPPTITLNGNNPFNLNLNTLFVEPGFVANDAEDGNITSNVVVSGSVNASSTGTYTLTYSVTDSGGLSTSTTRSVVVTQSGCTQNCGGGSSNPSVNISSNPPTIDKGGSSLISWTSLNTTSCSSLWTNSTSTSGSQNVTPTATTDYGITCIGQNGTTSATTTITVRNPENNSNGGGGGSSNSGGGGGSGSIGGRRRDISNLITPPQGEILGAISCLYLKDHLKIDWNNDPVEVLKLQSFLNVFEKESLSLTGVFNRSTFEAVERFQIKYKEDILIPWGDKVTTGFVYILTKKKINEIYCNSLFPVTPEEQREIDLFRSLSSVSTSSIDNGGGGTSISSDFYFSRDENSNKSENINAPIVELEDVSVIKNSAIKNAAISLFSVPARILGSNGYLILLIILCVFVVYSLFRWVFGDSEISESDSFEGDVSNKSVYKEESAPIIILPGISKSHSEDKDKPIPDEEIIIEKEEEDILR